VDAPPAMLGAVSAPATSNAGTISLILRAITVSSLVASLASERSRPRGRIYHFARFCAPLPTFAQPPDLRCPRDARTRPGAWHRRA
jgi:hypothetical protein